VAILSGTGVALVRGMSKGCNKLATVVRFSMASPVLGADESVAHSATHAWPDGVTGNYGLE